MNKVVKTLSILMMSAILILPVFTTVQAEEINNNTTEVVTYAKAKFGNASIKGNGIRLRKGPGTSATILGLLYDGDRIKLIHQEYTNGQWWYYIEIESGLKGYILPKYIRYD